MTKLDCICGEITMLTDDEIGAIRKFIDKEVDKRRAEVRRLKEEIAKEMNRLIKEFDSLNRSVSGNAIGTFVQDKDENENVYSIVGDVAKPIYGFRVDNDGDLMAVIDPNDKISNWAWHTEDEEEEDWFHS